MRALLGLISLSLASTTASADLRATDIMAVDPTLEAVVQIDPVTGDRTIFSSSAHGVGSGVTMQAPRDVVVEADGQLIVVDRGFIQRALLRIDAKTGDRSYASSATHGSGRLFQEPHGAAVGSDGSLYVTDRDLGGEAVYRVDPATGDRTVVSSWRLGVGSGPAFAPRGIAVDLDGSLVVGDARGWVFRIDPATGARAVVTSPSVGSGPQPRGGGRVAIEPDGRIVMTSFNDQALFRIDPASGDRSVIPVFIVSHPESVAIEQDGSILVASFLVIRIDPATGDITLVSATGGGFGTGPQLMSVQGMTVYPDRTIAVEIDIRPASDTNRVNPFGRAVVPVALLGSDAFDVGEVNPSTLVFGSGEAGPLQKPRSSYRDLNRDDFIDLIAYFRSAESAIAIGDTEACLRGETFDGAPFEGCDAVWTMPRGDRSHPGTGRAERRTRSKHPMGSASP